MPSLIPKVDFRDTQLPGVGFEIIDLEYLYQASRKTSDSYIGRAHRINFHNLVFITEGAGQHFVDFNSYPVETGSLVFINKHQVHKFDVENQPKGKLIVFTEDYLDQVVSAMDLQIFSPTHFVSSYLPSFQLCPAGRKSTMNLIELITDEYQTDKPNIKYLQILFAALLTKISEARPDVYRQKMNQNQIDLFDAFVSLLHREFTHHRDAQKYADRVGTTYKTLNKICKLATNRTAKQLIDAQILLEAKRSLIIENQQIQQISDKLGFDEATNFVKYFKKQTTMTPNQFRNSLQGD